MSRLCRDSEWPLSLGSPAEVSVEFHLDRFCRWLLSAGADPRLSLVLCAGDGAKQALIDGVQRRKVTPEIATATCRQPVAANLSAHQGTHFNSTLFIMDGLDTLDRDALNTLNGQRGLLNRMATWVAIVVEDMDTLCRLYQFSDGLMRDAARRLLIVSGHLPTGPQAIAPVGQTNVWRRSARVAELSFHTVMTQGQIADYDDVSRLFRTGYGAALNGSKSVAWTPWQRLWHGAEVGGAMTRDLASASVRHVSQANRTDELAGALTDRPICAWRLSSPTQGLAALLASGPKGTVSEWAHEVRAVTSTWSGRDAECAVTELFIAERYAAEENLEGCLSALNEGLSRSAGPACPEVFFELATLMLKLNILMGERKAALLLLNDLEERGPELHSPFYDGRIHLARGDYRAPLDRAPALEEYEAALRLFSIHGYLSWADTVHERVRSLS